MGSSLPIGDPAPRDGALPVATDVKAAEVTNEMRVGAHS